MASRTGNQNMPIRSLNMNGFGVQQGARQTPRLQNTQKTGLGNGNAGANWAFGAPSAFGSLSGSTPGLAVRPGQLSGFAQVMGGGGAQGPIDMSEFPTLSGAPRQQPTPTSSAATWNSTAIRQPTTAQQPPPPTQPRAPSTAPSHQSLDQPPSSYPNNAAAESPNQPHAQENGQAQSAPSSKPWAEMTEREKCGMAGLEAMFRYRRDRDNGLPGDQTFPQKQKTQALLMGHDLSSAALGLDLESPDPLYPTFAVFGDLYDGTDSSLAHRRPIPEFPLSDSYSVNNVPPLLPRMGGMSDETLFFVFYQNPRSIEQEQAGIELHARFWRWHKVLRKWLQKDTREANSATTPLLVDLTNGAPMEVPGTRTTQNTERAVFIFFEPTPHWRRERREFTLNYDELDHRQGGDNSFGPGIAGL